MSDHPAKQKVVDKLKDSETVLVTVSANPSVDELSATLGFTLLLNKMNKHATAVFSGDVPPAITFLDPEKTFENTVDSLRDFIIALDKERADHLRYKVDGDMVKIFITPYRTTIDQDDFEFSQGDYNVEMVVAIGVQAEDDLDRALSEHGRILHDATVASLSVGESKSQLGTIQWHDDKASSYSEMLVGVVEALKGSKNPIDEQIATAFLTGIVAATDRFSNTHTTSSAMTVAATLMAAGANQQLIATKLEEAEEIQSSRQDDDSDDSTDESADGKDGDSDSNANDESSDSSVLKVKRDETQPKKKPTNTTANQSKKEKEPVKDKPAPDGSMAISHEKEGTVDEVAEQVARERQEEAAKHAEAQLANSLAETAKPKSAVPSVDDLRHDLEKASEEADEAAEDAEKELSTPEPVLPAPVNPPQATGQLDEANQPKLGGTLNATSQQAAEDKRRELAADRNKTILSHDSSGYLETPLASDASENTYNQTVNMTSNSSASDTDSAKEQHHEASQRGKTIMPPSASSEPTLADIDAKNRGQDAARSEIKNVFEQQSSSSPAPASQESPQAAALPPLPPMPDFSTLPELPPDVAGEPDGFIPTPLPEAGAPPAAQPSTNTAAAPAPQATPFPQTQPAQPASFQPPVAAQQQVEQEKNLSDRLGDILPPAQPQSSAPQPKQASDPTQFQIPS